MELNLSLVLVLILMLGLQGLSVNIQGKTIEGPDHGTDEDMNLLRVLQRVLDNSVQLKDTRGAQRGWWYSYCYYCSSTKKTVRPKKKPKIKGRK